MGYWRPLLPWIVTSWTAAASESRRRVRSEATSTCSSATCARNQASSADDAEPLVHRHLVQRLADVAQVGQRALAADPAEHPGGEAVDHGGLEDGGHAPGGEDVGQGAHPVGEPVGLHVPAAVETRRRRRRRTT